MNALVTVIAASLGAQALVAQPLPDQRHKTIANFELVAGAHPQFPETPPTFQIVDETPDSSVRIRKILIAGPDNDAIPAYLLAPIKSAGKAPAMLCLHQTTRIGKSEPAGFGGKPNLHYARELAERGYVTLAPDYPNFGDYTFDPYTAGYASATMKGIVNHRLAVRLLASLPEVDARRIGVIGHSLGGHNALFVALFEPQIRAVVTSCGFTAFARYKGGDLTGWSHKGYMPRIASQFEKSPRQMPFDFPDLLAALADKSVFINAPLGDDNFDHEGVRQCVRFAELAFRTASGRLQAVYPDAGHDFPPDVRQQAYQFLDNALGGPNGQPH